MRWWKSWIVMLCVAGCAESQDPCQANGERFTTADGDFCLYSADSPLVIEGGFECPPAFGFRFETEAGIACGEQELEALPESVCARLGAECDPPPEPERPSARPSSEPSGGDDPPSTGSGGPPDDDPWRQVAEDRGFLPQLEGKDFFETMGYACIVDTSPRPIVWTELVGEVDQVVLARITAVEVDPELPPPPNEVADENVYLQLDVQDTAKGASEASIRVQDTCGSGGLVWPLRNKIPDGSFVFFLHAPEEPDGAWQLAYFYLGIVRDTAAGLDFALGDGSDEPSLAEFDSLEALMEGVRAQGS